MGAMLVLAPVLGVVVLRMRRYSDGRSVPDGPPHARAGTTVVDAITLGRVRAGLTSDDPVMRAESVDGLEALGDAKGLRAALRSPDAYVRTRAVKALGSLDGDAIVWRLVPLAWDPATAVRFAVAEVLARRAGWLATWALRHLASDEEAVLRYTALTALTHLDRRWVVPRLQVVRATDPELWLRDAAAALLRRCGVTEST